MRDYPRDVESDHGLRLEDISRRSACDRCRTMKTRCERSHHRGMARLEQCRRCRQAQVKCITTLETEQQWSDVEGQPSRRQRKRPREDSVEANNLYPVPATPQSLDEQHNNAQPERYTAHATFNTPSFFSLPTTSSPTDGLLPTPGIDSQWDELSRIVNLEESVMPNLHSDMAISSANQTLRTEASTGSSMFIPTITMPNISRTSQQFNPAASGDRNFLLDSSPLLSALDSSGIETLPTEANWTIIHKLMDFNTDLLHDLQDARESDRAWGEGRDMLRKILHHSNVFLELLGNFTRDRETPARKPAHSRSSEPYHAGSAGGQCRKVDTDLALQLLSCHINMSSLYKVLCKVLTTQTTQLDEAQALTALRLEGLQNLDRDMRLQVLVHICSLTFAKIQTELDAIRGRGALTQGADAIFHAALGGESSRAASPVFDEAQILAKFRQLVMARSSSSL